MCDGIIKGTPKGEERLKERENVRKSDQIQENTQRPTSPPHTFIPPNGLLFFSQFPSRKNKMVGQPTREKVCGSEKEEEVLDIETFKI
jgi:hypothetical protein